MVNKVGSFSRIDLSKIDLMDKAGQVIDLMQLGQVPVSTDLFHCLLQGCTKRKDLVTGRRLHLLLVSSELDSVAILGDLLIRLFASCGSLMEANLLFCKVSKASAYTWQAIINAHVLLGETNRALELYHKMQEKGIRPGKYIFSCVLKACGSIRELSQGKLIHRMVIRYGLQSDVVIGNTLIGMYAKCGCVDEALKVFHELLNRDLVSWNAIMAGCTQHGHGLLAIKLFERMQEEDARPDGVTFLCVLKACGMIGTMELGQWIHGHIIRCGLESDMVLGSSLLYMYGKCGSLECAHKVFQELPNRSVVSWNGIIAGYAQHGHGLRALQLFEKMQAEGIKPNKVSFLCIVKACACRELVGQGRSIHEIIMEHGLESDMAVGNALVDMYSKCGNLDMARKVFNKLPDKDVVSWGALISGHLEHGYDLFALKLFAKMQEEGIEPDRVTFLGALKACGSTGDRGHGKLIHEAVIKCGLESESVIGNTLVDMYAKCGSVEEARKIFDRLPNSDAVSCNAMIAAYAQHGHGLYALEVLKAMQQEGIKPDDVTFACILKACGSIGAIEQGKLIHDQIIRGNFGSDTVVMTTMLTMYAKCGSLEEARYVFDSTPNPTLISWSAMVAAYAQHGHYYLVAHCIEDMQRQGFQPDGKVFVSLLMACGHVGQVEEGYRLFQSMEEQGITPTGEHLNCMVDLLSRTGRLKEAEKFLQTMPFSSDATGWMSLLTACRTYGNTELGRQCFDQIVRLDRTIPGGYVLMSNIYADSHKWEDVHQVQRLKSAADAQREPGRAWIEVNNKVHEFTVEDGTHLQSYQIIAKLNRVKSLVTEKGYVPQMDLVLSQRRQAM